MEQSRIKPIPNLINRVKIHSIRRQSWQSFIRCWCSTTKRIRISTNDNKIRCWATKASICKCMDVEFGSNFIFSLKESHHWNQMQMVLLENPWKRTLFQLSVNQKQGIFRFWSLTCVWHLLRLLKKLVKGWLIRLSFLIWRPFSGKLTWYTYYMI